MDITQVFNLVLLFGGVVTILMATLLWFYVENNPANRVLAVLILVWGLTVFAFVVQSRAFFLTYPHTFGIGTSLNLLYFPLVYFYIKIFLRIELRRFKQYAIHFLPYAIYIIAISPFFFQDGATKAEYFKAGNLPHWITVLLNVADVVIIFQGLVYTVMSVRTIHWCQYFRGSVNSSIDENTVSWLKQFIIINSVLWVVGTTSVYIESTISKIPFDLFKVFYMGITILIFWMGVLAIKRTRFFSFQNVKNESNDEPSGSVVLEEYIDLSDNQIEDDTLPKSNKELIEEVMLQEKPYLESDMALQDIAEKTTLSKGQVSEILKDDFGQSFYDFVSEFRTKEVIRLIGEGKTKEYTLLHISEMAGFNSKATFYRAFKKHTGKTPKEYVNLFKR